MIKGKKNLKVIDSPVYRYWLALYLSFYSRRLYVDVGKRWKGLGLLYLLLVISLFSFPFAWRVSDSLGDAFKTQVTDPLLEIPVFYIQNGEASFDKPMPYLIKNAQNQVIAIIDTTGKVNDFSAAYPHMTILINKDKLALKIPKPQLFNDIALSADEGTPMVQTFSKETNLVFDAKNLMESNSIHRLMYVSRAMVYPLIVALFFSVFLVFFLVLGLLGQFFSRIFFSFKISFMNATRLLIVAGTPMLLFLMMALTFNRIFQGVGFILCSLLILYYSFALYSLRAESRYVVIQ